MDRDASTVLDELLVSTAQAGSSLAFRQVVTRWTPKLQRHAERLLLNADQAADVVQDAWVNIARDISRLDDPARFPGWAYAIVTRRCIDAVRRHSRHRRLVARAASDALAKPPSADCASELNGHIDLAAAIRALPVDQRLMLSLHYGEGQSVEDIASAQRLPAGTVKSRLYAARRTLKDILEGAVHDKR